MGSRLFRLWLVATVLWIGLMIFVSRYDSRADAFWIYLQTAAVAPAVILIVGAMLRWALKSRT